MKKRIQSAREVRTWTRQPDCFELATAAALGVRLYQEEEREPRDAQCEQDSGSPRGNPGEARAWHAADGPGAFMPDRTFR